MICAAPRRAGRRQMRAESTGTPRCVPHRMELAHAPGVKSDGSLRFHGLDSHGASTTTPDRPGGQAPGRSSRDRDLCYLELGRGGAGDGLAGPRDRAERPGGLGCGAVDGLCSPFRAGLRRGVWRRRRRPCHRLPLGLSDRHRLRRIRAAGRCPGLRTVRGPRGAAIPGDRRDRSPPASDLRRAGVPLGDRGRAGRTGDASVVPLAFRAHPDRFHAVRAGRWDRRLDGRIVPDVLGGGGPGPRGGVPRAAARLPDSHRRLRGLDRLRPGHDGSIRLTARRAAGGRHRAGPRLQRRRGATSNRRGSTWPGSSS